MKRLFSILLAALVLALAVPALADAPQVTVTGSAQISAPADHAVVRLGVMTRADTPSQAQQENSLRTDAVIQALTEVCGLSADQIATSNFSIYTMSEWVSETSAERQYYQVSHDLTVTVKDIDRAGAVIDAAVAAGANIVNNVSFESASMKEAYDQALVQAIADAKRKAEIIAEACGMSLGDVVTVSTVGSGDFYYTNTFRLAATEEAAAGADTKLVPGTQSASATVTVTWSLK